MRLAEQAQVGRDADHRHGGGVLVGDFLGRRVEPPLVDGRIFGERSLAAEQPLVAPPDAVPLAILCRARSDRLDHAGQVASDDKRLRQVHRIHARADVRIDRVDGHCLDLDEDLAFGRFRLRQIAEDDVFGRARLFDVRSFHVGVSEAIQLDLSGSHTPTTWPKRG